MTTLTPAEKLHMMATVMTEMKLEIQELRKQLGEAEQRVTQICDLRDKYKAMSTPESREFARQISLALDTTKWMAN